MVFGGDFCMHGSMMGFFIVICSLMVCLAGLAFWVVSYVFAGSRLQQVRRGMLLFDGIVVLGMAVRIRLPGGEMVTAAALQIAAIGFMIQFFGVVLVLGAVLLRWFYRRMAAVPVDGERRRLLRQAFLFPAAAAAAGVYGGLYEREHTVERHYDIFVRGMDGPLEGYRIAQISDVHLGMFFSLDSLRQLLQRVAGGHPDVLVITGDLFDDDDVNQEAVRLVDRFAGYFPQGIWFCYGNHEHMRDLQRIRMALSASRIHVLVNANAEVVGGRQPLYFAGVDYPMPREDFDALQASYTKKALQGIPSEAITVLLAHHPIFFDCAAAHGVPLTLSGHTHGGQLGLFGVPLVPPLFKYMRGLYQQQGCYCYVHSGNGSWFPYRIGCPPEIAYFSLRGIAERD